MLTFVLWAIDDDVLIFQQFFPVHLFYCETFLIAWSFEFASFNKKFLSQHQTVRCDTLI